MKGPVSTAMRIVEAKVHDLGDSRKQSVGDLLWIIWRREGWSRLTPRVGGLDVRIP